MAELRFKARSVWIQVSLHQFWGFHSASNLPFSPQSKLDLEGTTLELIPLPEKRWYLWKCLILSLDHVFTYLSHTIPKTCLGGLQRCTEPTRHIVGAHIKSLVGCHLLQCEVGGWHLKEQSYTWVKGDQVPGALLPVVPNSSLVLRDAALAKTPSLWPAHRRGCLSLMDSTPSLNLWILDV